MSQVFNRSILFLVVTNLFCTPLSAVQENLEEFIERDSTAFIVVQDPSAALEQIESSAFFQNRRFQRALELLVDEEFPLTTQARLDEIQNKWIEAREAISRFNEISFIIHTWPDDRWSVPKFTVAFTGSSERVQQLESLLNDAGSSLLAQDDEASDFFSRLLRTRIKNAFVHPSGNTLFLSNAPDRAQEIVNRLENSTNEKFKSLASNRSYLQVQNLLSERNQSPQVRGFLAPKSFRKLMTKLVAGEQTIMVESPRSLASAGFQVLLQTDADSVSTPEGNYRPVINWDFVLTYTQPASGFGKLIESFEPLADLPPLPYEVTALKGLGFDLTKKYEADKEIFEKYQKKFINMSFDKFFQWSEFGLISVDEDVDAESLLDTATNSISVYHRGNPTHWKPAMNLRKVSNRQAMESLLADILKRENRSSGDKDRLVEVSNEHGRLFARTEVGVREHLRKLAKNWQANGDEPPKTLTPPPGEALSADIMSQQYEYFISDDWMVHADHNSMRQFLEAVYEGEFEPTTFDLLYENSAVASGQDSFFKITYQSNQFYMVKDKAQQSSVESARIKTKFGDFTTEAWDKLMSEPDEYGLRIEIESTEDAAVAVQQLVANAFNDTFGTSISLYSKDDNKMRIFGQVYSLVDE